MEKDNRKNEILEQMANTEFYPSPLNEEEVNVKNHMKLPLSKLTHLGVAFEPLMVTFKNFLSSDAASGLYMVNTKGGTLVNSAQGPGFIGALSRGNNQIGGGMAVLNPVSFNPTMLCMAAVLANIDKKLDSIIEAQKEIIEFLEQREKSKLRGNLNFLTDVMNNYKFNWTNEKYKNSNHIKVLDIKQESEQGILFYREQIVKKLKKQTFFHSDKDVKDKLDKIQSELKEYQLVLYLFAFSSFLEVLLLENFKSVYLDGVVNKISDYAFKYRELYTECYNKIEGYSKSSVQSHLLNGLVSINKTVGNAVAKIPVVNKSQIDETLIETSSRIDKFSSRRTEQNMAQLLDKQNSEVNLFIVNINTINKLYNEPLEFVFDNENIYLSVT